MKQIWEFLRNPKERKVEFKLRRLIREVQEFCPKAATTTRELALHCLETNRGNLICPYHGERGKDGKTNDESVTEASPHLVTGTPYIRSVKGRGGGENAHHDGHLHCGCPEDAVLLDFFLWKETEISSPVHDFTEGWKDQRLDPRARLLVATAWEQWTGLTVYDMYRGKSNYFDAEVARLKYQVGSLQEALTEAEQKRDGKKRRG
jgi:hypothetical protein